MLKSQVKIGETYQVKVSNQLVPVMIVEECPYGGWYGKNMTTGRQVRIRTAGRLRKVMVVEE